MCSGCSAGKITDKQDYEEKVQTELEINGMIIPLSQVSNRFARLFSFLQSALPGAIALGTSWNHTFAPQSVIASMIPGTIIPGIELEIVALHQKVRLQARFQVL